MNVDPAGPIWIHGLRSPRRRLALHPETAWLTASQLRLGDLAAQWLLASSTSPCYIGSRNRDLVLTTFAVRGAVHLRVDRIRGTAIRLGAASKFTAVLQQGTFWAEPARIGDSAILVIPDALKLVVAPEYQISGLLWTTYTDPGRTLCIDDQAWAEIASEVSPEEVEARTSMRPIRRARWQKPPPAGVEPKPSWKLRLETDQRRHARSPGPGSITVMAGQIVVPMDVLGALGNPAAISIGLLRLRSGDVTVVLAAATPERAGYVVRMPRRTGAPPTLRLDARAAWLRAIMGKGSFRVEIGGPVVLVPGLIRPPRTDTELQGFPAEVAELFAEPVAAQQNRDATPGAPSQPGIVRTNQHAAPVGIAS